MASKKIRIVTDSVSDMPADWVEKWQVPIIPCSVTYNGETYVDDGEELDRQHFYQSMPDLEVFPSTAAPSVGLAEEMLQEALEGYDHLIGIHVPEVYSATINNIRLAAESLPQDRVTIIDAQSLSMGMAFQVVVAAEVAQKTGDVEKVIQAIKAVQQNHQVYAAFYTLEYLKRSGRVNSMLASIGTLLRIKPIVNAVGNSIDPVARIRTFNKAKQKVREFIEAEAPLDRLVMLHIQNEADARALRDELGDIVPANTPIIEVGPTLGTHIGPGSVGAATLNTRWKNQVGLD